MMWLRRSDATNRMEKMADILRHDHWVTRNLCEDRPQDASNQNRQTAGLWRLFIIRCGRQGGPDVRTSRYVSLFFAWVHTTSVAAGRLSAWAIGLLEQSFQTSFPALPCEFLTSRVPLIVYLTETLQSNANCCRFQRTVFHRSELCHSLCVKPFKFIDVLL